MVDNDKQVEQNKRNWLRQRLFPMLTLLFIIAISVGIFFFYRSYPGRVEQLRGFGYLGVFIISLTFNATVVLPAGNFLILFVMGGALPLPAVVGLAGGAGAAIGEITGYAAGRSGRAMVARQGKTYARLERWVKRWGALAIFLMSVVPFVFDLVGIAAGALRFPFWRFLLFCWLGRTILYILIAFAGAWGWRMILPYFS